MITAESALVAIGDSINEMVISFKGLSTDTKPTETYNGMGIQNGSTFFEMDTQEIKCYNADSRTWI